MRFNKIQIPLNMLLTVHPLYFFIVPMLSSHIDNRYFRTSICKEGEGIITETRGTDRYPLSQDLDNVKIPSTNQYCMGFFRYLHVGYKLQVITSNYLY